MDFRVPNFDFEEKFLTSIRFGWILHFNDPLTVQYSPFPNRYTETQTCEKCDEGKILKKSIPRTTRLHKSQESPLKMAKLISGNEISKAIRGEIKIEVDTMSSKPALAVVLVGDNKGSQTYVRLKKKACNEVGIRSVEKLYAETISEEELILAVKELNDDEEIDGILVQLPLPKHISEERVLNEISLDKDVDGFHPLNIGKLCMKGREPTAIPCTPKGCIELLDRMGIEISGKRAVVIGRSNIVGIPVAMLLMHRNATVSIVHSRTRNTPEIVRQADIIVAACGVTQMVKKSWVKPGAVIIDVGINSIPDKTKKRGYRLVGDVDFNGCKEVAAFITPVPGGVGPMTISMLLKNTLEARKTKDKKMKDLGTLIHPKLSYYIVNGSCVLTSVSTFLIKSFYFGHDFENKWSTGNWLLFSSLVGTGVKRVLETYFLHKFTRKESLKKTLGIMAYAQSFVLPLSLTVINEDFKINKSTFYYYFALFLGSQVANFMAHVKLRQMYQKNPRRRKVPDGPLFKLVSCPNYVAEWGIWLGISGMTDWTPAGLFTASLNGLTLFQLAQEKHKKYLKKFGKEYPKERKAFIPFLF